MQRMIQFNSKGLKKCPKWLIVNPKIFWTNGRTERADGRTDQDNNYNGLK